MTNIGAPHLYGHARCWQTDDYSGKPGDVKRCEHGRIMYCYQRGGVIGRMGHGSMFSFWRPLNPVFEPFRYRKAKRALEATSRRTGRTPRCGKSVGAGRNGVYECERPSGHDGKHWRITPPKQLPSTLTSLQDKPLNLGLIKIKKGGI